jgi:DNA polymerase
MLSIDFETRSTVDLRKTGVYPYAQHETTDVYCMAYALPGKPIQVWEPGDDVPLEVVEAAFDGTTLCAWNAQFERIIWDNIMVPRYGFPALQLEQWHCTASQAALMSLPRSLDQASKALGVATEKDMAGNRLMQTMCRPRRIEDDGTIVWWTERDRVERLKEYCATDVQVEQLIAEKLAAFPEKEQSLYLLDQRINDRGLAIDLDLVQAGDRLLGEAFERAGRKLSELTGGHCRTVTNTGCMADWIEKVKGYQVNSLDKKAVVEMLERIDDPEVTAVLQLRQDTGKTSTAKLKAMKEAACSDGRVRGTLLFAGASRTGRWSGRLVQPHNFPRPENPNPEAAIPDVLDGNLDVIEMLYGPAPQVVSDLLRACITCHPEKQLIAADFSAIEARVLAWITGQDDLVEAFATGADVYKRMAGAIYGCDPSEINKDQRQMGKMAVLGCGYGMGGPKFRTSVRDMVGVDLPDEEAKRIVDAYRRTHPEIVSFWYETERAAIQAVENPGEVQEAGKVKFARKGSWLICALPSGRKLWYCLPVVIEQETPWGEMRPQLEFTGMVSMTRKWARQTMYGGRWAENIVQAVARDLLADAMLRLEDAGYSVVGSVHDEIITEVKAGFGSVEEVETLMSVVPEWAEGCPLAAEGWSSNRFKK